MCNVFYVHVYLLYISHILNITIYDKNNNNFQEKNKKMYRNIEIHDGKDRRKILLVIKSH